MQIKITNNIKLNLKNREIDPIDLDDLNSFTALDVELRALSALIESIKYNFEKDELDIKGDFSEIPSVFYNYGSVEEVE